MSAGVVIDPSGWRTLAVRRSVLPPSTDVMVGQHGERRLGVIRNFERRAGLAAHAGRGSGEDEGEQGQGPHLSLQGASGRVTAAPTAPPGACPGRTVRPTLSGEVHLPLTSRSFIAHAQTRDLRRADLDRRRRPSRGAAAAAARAAGASGRGRRARHVPRQGGRLPLARERGRQRPPRAGAAALLDAAPAAPGGRSGQRSAAARSGRRRAATSPSSRAGWPRAISAGAAAVYAVHFSTGSS